jgi:hypothetical protein
MSEIGQPEREIIVVPAEEPVPRELPAEPAPREPAPSPDGVPA